MMIESSRLSRDGASNHCTIDGKTVRLCGPFLFEAFFAPLSLVKMKNCSIGCEDLDITRKFLVILFALGLSACAATDSVNLEGREISVDQSAEPASADASGPIARLLPSTGPTYVTLTVSAGESRAGARKSDDQKRAVTSGSGFVIDSGGYVMTAAHVAVNKGNSVSARAANGRVYSGVVTSILPSNDMAIIKLRGYSGKTVNPTAPECSSRGELIYTLGRPHAQGDTARVGTLESLHFGRAVVYGKFGYPDAMVLKMGTQKGESGGPVFDSNGQLIGMVVSTLSDASGRSVNLAHAIPATALASFFCSQSTCSSAWSNIAARTLGACTG